MLKCQKLDLMTELYLDIYESRVEFRAITLPLILLKPQIKLSGLY